jgi:hypothetical protein
MTHRPLRPDLAGAWLFARAAPPHGRPIRPMGAGNLAQLATRGAAPRNFD